MPTNTDPFAPWNDPMEKDNPFAPHNDPMDKHNPFKPWNEPCGKAEDLTKKERDEYRKHGVRI